MAGSRKPVESMNAVQVLSARQSHGRKNFSNVTLLGANNGDVCILEGVDLSGCNFKGAQLSFVNLSRANLAGANFTGADLYRANLDGADLRGADLRKVKNFEYVNVRNAQVLGANFAGADINGGNHDQISAIFESALLRDNPSAEVRAERETAIAFIRGHGRNLCWDGLVKHFRKTAPQSLIWGMRLLKETNLKDDAAGYDPVLYTIDGADVQKLDTGVLSDLVVGERAAVRDESNFDEATYVEVTVKQVYASGAIAVDYDDEEYLFSPHGTNLGDGDGDSYPDSDLSLVLLTDDIKQSIEHTQLMERFQEDEIDFSELTTAQLRRIAAIIDGN